MLILLLGFWGVGRLPCDPALLNPGGLSASTCPQKDLVVVTRAPPTGRSTLCSDHVGCPCALGTLAAVSEVQEASSSLTRRAPPVFLLWGTRFILILRRDYLILRVKANSGQQLPGPDHMQVLELAFRQDLCNAGSILLCPSRRALPAKPSSAR